MTLVELLVASALFLLFLTIAGGMIVHMLNCYRQGEEIVRPVAAARNAMSVMGSSWRSAFRIMIPEGMDKSTWEGELARGTERVTLHIYQDTGAPGEAFKYLRYSLAPDRTLICEELFGKWGPVKGTRPLLRNCDRLQFRRMPRDPVVTIELSTTVGVTPAPYPLQTLTFMRANPPTE